MAPVTRSRFLALGIREVTAKVEEHLTDNLEFEVDLRAEPGACSDYGSDLDVEGDEVKTFLEQVDGGAEQPLVLENLELDNHAGGRFVAVVPLFCSQDARRIDADIQTSPLALRGLVQEGSEFPTTVSVYSDKGATTQLYPSLRSEVSFEKLGTERKNLLHAELIADQQKNLGNDTRSPLERFRTHPRKPLSVTDLVSPAWCELQYWYTLNKSGKKRRTPAMKQGTKVHKNLEEKVHTFVPVDVETREDQWGLKIWNVIQGIRTLKTTGYTRELEVWGIIDGEVVNGSIDEVSFVCPDENMEADIAPENKASSGHLGRNQTSMSQFVTTDSHISSSWPGTVYNPDSTRKVYLTDTKTIMRNRLPSGSMTFPSKMQLMLYRRLLRNMASNQVAADTIFARYNLNPQNTFSDVFIRRIASLHEPGLSTDTWSSSDTAHSSSPNADTSDITTYNNLNMLWSLMISELATVVPTPQSVGQTLHIEYRQQSDGSVIGNRNFAYSDKSLDEHISSVMSWWRGRREAKGVEIEDAFKCRSCDFADGCEWRANKISSLIELGRRRRLEAMDSTNSKTSGVRFAG